MDSEKEKTPATVIAGEGISLSCSYTFADYLKEQIGNLYNEFIMFREVVCKEDNLIGIPCYGSDKYRWLTWGEEETYEDVLIRHSQDNDINIYSRFKVWPVGDDSGDYSETEINIYEMTCCKSNIVYFLVVYGCLNEFDDILHSVALPYNKLNLISFFNKYMINLAGKPYVNGD